jgi:hypothetical protein
MDPIEAWDWTSNSIKKNKRRKVGCENQGAGFLIPVSTV